MPIPTMANPDEVKDKFYDDNITSASHHQDSEGVGKCNSNGLLLLRKCVEHDLLITNTVFRLPNRNKTSSPIQ